MEKIYEEAVKTFGVLDTAYKFIEEMSECQKEVCKWLEGQGDAEHMAEEMVDVYITYAKWMFVMQANVRGFGALCKKYEKEKLERLQELIDKAR